jgi:hypothetical protein
MRNHLDEIREKPRAVNSAEQAKALDKDAARLLDPPF